MNDDMIYTELFSEPQQTTQLVIEQQIDEISLNQIGRGIGNVLGGVGTTVGAIGGVPQGIGRAIKKGYRSSVKGIGGEADPEPAATGTQATTAVSQPTTTVQPKAEMPIGSGTINPRTGRPYVPSDFPTSADDQPDTAAQSTTAAQSSNRDAAAIQADIRNLDSSYKMRRNTLNRELEAAQSQPEPTAAQPEPAALAQPEPTVPTSVSVGGQKIPPSDPLYAKVAAALQNKPLLQSIQALDPQKLATVKQILQRKVRGKLEEKALGAMLRTAGRALKATPGYLARGAGAVSGVAGGMKQAYSKAKQASTKFIGQGALSWDDVQIELANLSAEDAKALLSFVNQLTVSAPKAKRKSKSNPVAKAKPTPAVTTPAFTGRSPAAATVHESLTWSKNFDPGRHLMSQITRP
jgi:hypothetical protein